MIRFNISYIIRMPFACYLYGLIFYLYILLCHPHVTRMYSYVIRMSLVRARMSSICHLYVLVCHLYVTHMYSYVIRMSLVCGFTMNHQKQYSTQKLAYCTLQLATYYQSSRSKNIEHSSLEGGVLWHWVNCHWVSYGEQLNVIWFLFGF